MGAAKRECDKGDGNVDSPIGRAAILGRGAFFRHPAENTARRDVVLHETGEVFLAGSIELQMGRGLRTMVGASFGTSFDTIFGTFTAPTLSAALDLTFGAARSLIAIPIVRTVGGLITDSAFMRQGLFSARRI